jgi:DNA-binding CsgD family transcriptional regulator
MARSQRVTMSEMARMLRLAREIADSPPDPRARVRRAMQGLAETVGGRAASLSAWRAKSPNVHQCPRQIDALRPFDADLYGIDGSREAKLLSEYFSSFDPPDPTLPHLLAQPGNQCTTRRERVFDERAWHGSAHFNEVRRPLGIDYSVSTVIFADNDPSVLLICLHRGLRDRRFGKREEEMIRIFFRELRPILLAEQQCPARARLSPRERDVLRHLLDGQAPKQIARALNLSVFTVRDYVKEIYSKFKVHGRDELMARFIKAWSHWQTPPPD